MNRPFSIFSAGSLAKTGAALAGLSLAGVWGPVGSTFAQVPEPAPPPEIVIDVEPPEAARVEVDVEAEARPEGQPAEISDWALAGVVWSDAHLVRKLAQAAAEETENSEYREKMALLVNDCDALINSLETFGWRRIAAERAEQQVAAAAAAAAPTAVEADVVVTEQARRVPLDPDEAAAALDIVSEGGLTGEVTAEDRPFTFRRYRVADYIDEVPLDPDTPAEATAEGVEEAVAAAPDKTDAAFDALEGTGPDSRRQAQTHSATLPYAGDSIYDVEDLHPSAPYPDRPDAVAAGLERDPPRVTSLRPATEAVETVVPPNVPTEELLDEAVLQPAVPSVATIDITRYTDRAEKFRQDTHWVKFRLTANQQRWRMLQNSGDDESAPELAEHLDAALLQLQADAATALAASKDSQLAEVLRDVVN